MLKKNYKQHTDFNESEQHKSLKKRNIILEFFFNC